MIFYSIFAYFVVGIIIGLLGLKAVDQGTGPLANGRSIDNDMIGLSFMIFIFAPLTLPIGLFIWVMLEISKFIYRKFMV